MPIRTISWFVGLWSAGLIVGLSSHAATAAPQILAVLESRAGVPFTCADGVCAADLSTFCLQRDRPAPEHGAVYVPAAPGVFTLVLTDESGGERRLAAGAHVAFSEHRGFTAVTARVPESVLAELGAVGARIEIAAGASLLPAPQAGDPDPLTAEEIALAVGPLRALASQVVDESADAKAARVVATMVNLLPPEGRVGPLRRATLWRDAAGGDRAAATESPGLSRAKAVYDRCIDAIAEPSVFSMRSCLETRHDRLMRELNVDYWNANVGS